MPGRGTSEKDKPPILGVIQRGGPVVLHMLANVRQTTIQPIIAATVAKGALVHTDEYGVYARLQAWGYQHKRSAIPGVSMRATRMATGSARCTSTPWKG
jgi:hypothetical protein